MPANMPVNTNTTATTAVPPNQASSGLLDAFNPGAIPGAIAWIVGAIVAVRFINRFVARMSKRVARHRLVFKQVGTLLAFSLYVMALSLALSGLFTLSSQALLALSGTIAVTVGFALKDVAASFFAGITILINRPFQVGDRISFGGYYGEVKEIGLRTVRLVTLDDNLVTIPTNKFLTAKAYVYDAQHEKAFASDVTDRVLSAFRASGIRMIGDCPPETPDKQPVLVA